MTALSIFWLIVVFVFGSVVGSFINVFIYRVPLGKSLLWPPSHCPHCFTPVGIYNLPIIGWFLVGGRCRRCRARLSLQYPGVEFLSAALVTFAFWRMVLIQGKPLPLFFIYVFLLWALLAVTFVDLRWRIIPDQISYLLIVAGPVLAAIYPPLMQSSLVQFSHWSGMGTLGRISGWLVEHPRLGAPVASLVGIATGTLLILMVRTLGTAVFRKEAMGLGDVKLLGAVGGLLGAKTVPLIFLVAVFAGAILGLVLYLRTRRHDIPFGPYLALGTAVVLFYGNELWRWFLTLFYLHGPDPLLW